MYVTFGSVSEYLFLLRAACELLSPCGVNALLYLAAAVSDYYLPYEAMSEHKIQSSSGPLTLTLMPVPKVCTVMLMMCCSCRGLDDKL